MKKRTSKQQVTPFILDVTKCKLIKLTPDYCDDPLFNQLQGKTVTLDEIAKVIAEWEETDNIIAYFEIGGDCMRKHETQRYNEGNPLPLDLVKTPYATAEDIKVDQFGLLRF